MVKERMVCWFSSVDLAALLQCIKTRRRIPCCSCRPFKGEKLRVHKYKKSSPIGKALMNCLLKYFLHSDAVCCVVIDVLSVL